MEGELDKWTNWLGGWKKRYCVVKGEIFYYYNNKGEPVKGKAHLGTSKIEEYSKESTKFELDTGCAYFHFRASSIDEKKNWLNALKKAKLSADQQLNKGLEQIETIPPQVSTAIPDRMSYLLSLANNLAKSNSNFVQFITTNYEVEQETANQLLDMLKSHNNENNKFIKEIENLSANLNNFALHYNSLSQFLKASGQFKNQSEQYFGNEVSKYQVDNVKQSKN